MEKRSFFIVGKHAVMEALKNPNRQVKRLFLTEESKKIIHRNSPRINLLKDIKVHFKNKKELDNYSKKDQITHQGFVAEVEHLENIEIKEYIKNRKGSTFACLDEVTDPRNIGSIIRSAASFNIDGIIVKERHFPDESKIMYKSSSGCIEHTNIFKVSNINTTLKYLRENKYSWINVQDTAHLTKFRDYYDIYSTPVAFILDKERRIIGKRIDPPAIDNFLKELYKEEEESDEEK